MIDCEHTKPLVGAITVTVTPTLTCTFCELDRLRDLKRATARYIAAVDQITQLEETGRLHMLPTDQWLAVYAERDASEAAVRKALEA